MNECHGHNCGWCDKCQNDIRVHEKMMKLSEIASAANGLITRVFGIRGGHIPTLLVEVGDRIKRLEKDLEYEHPCWLVWEQAPDGKHPYLASVDFTPEIAERHRTHLIAVGKLVHIEKSKVNHLYGENMTKMFNEMRTKLKSST